MGIRRCIDSTLLIHTSDDRNQLRKDPDIGIPEWPDLYFLLVSAHVLTST
jgi:hypothetical protein